VWESHLHGSERGWRTTLLWMRYCGTVGGNQAANRENKLHPIGRGGSGLLKKIKRLGSGKMR